MNRIEYADYLRIIGIIGIIGVHLSGDYLSKTVLFSNMWYQGVLYSSLTRSGALLFIMVSGMLLLDRPQSIDKIPHRVTRVMIPFIFWLLLIFSKGVFIDHTFVVTSPGDFITQFINCVLNPNIISEEYWYIYMIIGIYLILPIIRPWIENCDEKEIRYFLVIWFIVLTLNYFGIKIMLLDYVNLFVGHFGFFVLGYYLSKKESRFTSNIWTGVLLFIVGTALTFISIYLPTLISQELNLTYLYVFNLTPGFVFKAAGTFLIFKNINYRKLWGKYANIMNHYAIKIAEMTYGLYLAHILIPVTVANYVGISPFITIPALIVYISIIIFAVLLIMNRIPILQMFTGMPYLNVRKTKE